jgi:hypothetical protein
VVENKNRALSMFDRSERTRRGSRVHRSSWYAGEHPCTIDVFFDARREGNYEYGQWIGGSVAVRTPVLVELFTRKAAQPARRIPCWES